MLPVRHFDQIKIIELGLKNDQKLAFDPVSRQFSVHSLDTRLPKNVIIQPIPLFNEMMQEIEQQTQLGKDLQKRLNCKILNRLATQDDFDDNALCMTNEGERYTVHYCRQRKVYAFSWGFGEWDVLTHAFNYATIWTKLKGIPSFFFFSLGISSRDQAWKRGELIVEFRSSGPHMVGYATPYHTYSYKLLNDSLPLLLKELELCYYFAERPLLKHFHFVPHTNSTSLPPKKEIVTVNYRIKHDIVEVIYGICWKHFKTNSMPPDMAAQLEEMLDEKTSLIKLDKLEQWAASHKWELKKTDLQHPVDFSKTNVCWYMEHKPTLWYLYLPTEEKKDLPFKNFDSTLALIDLELKTRPFCLDLQHLAPLYSFKPVVSFTDQSYIENPPNTVLLHFKDNSVSFVDFEPTRLIPLGTCTPQELLEKIATHLENRIKKNAAKLGVDWVEKGLNPSVSISPGSKTALQWSYRSILLHYWSPFGSEQETTDLLSLHENINKIESRQALFNSLQSEHNKNLPIIYKESIHNVESASLIYFIPEKKFRYFDCFVYNPLDHKPCLIVTVILLTDNYLLSVQKAQAKIAYYQHLLEENEYWINREDITNTLIGCFIKDFCNTPQIEEELYKPRVSLLIDKILDDLIVNRLPLLLIDHLKNGRIGTQKFYELKRTIEREIKVINSKPSLDQSSINNMLEMGKALVQTDRLASLSDKDDEREWQIATIVSINDDFQEKRQTLKIEKKEALEKANTEYAKNMIKLNYCEGILEAYKQAESRLSEKLLGRKSSLIQEVKKRYDIDLTNECWILAKQDGLITEDKKMTRGGVRTLLILEGFIKREEGKEDTVCSLS